MFKNRQISGIPSVGIHDEDDGGEDDYNDDDHDHDEDDEIQIEVQRQIKTAAMMRHT